jgi:5-methylcytosine-specific restriction endonuclease McrA
MARDYKSEYKKYHSKDEQKKKRAARNAARRTMEKEGKVSKGDGNDVNHKKPLAKGGSNERSNLNVKPKSANRSFPRTKRARMK